MKISFDPIHNVAYFHFKDERAEVETVQIAVDVNADITPDGSLYGIELLNANEQLGWERGAVLKIVNEASGAISEVRLPDCSSPKGE